MYKDNFVGLSVSVLLCLLLKKSVNEKYILLHTFEKSRVIDVIVYGCYS
jgi:hypothetical protein